MAFSTATMIGLPVVKLAGKDMKVSWRSSSPAGTMFQVYVSGGLAWAGTKTRCFLPMPKSRVYVVVGTVGPTERYVNFASSLPAMPLDSVLLEWDGGTWEQTVLPLSGFHIYSSAVAGGAVDYTKVIGSVGANVAGVYPPGGWNQGGWNLAGWGDTSNPSYSWRSPPYPGGTFTFAVAPYDTAGNENHSPLTVSVTFTAPPAPPARNANRQRLTYTFNASTRVATLAWIAPP